MRFRWTDEEGNLCYSIGFLVDKDSGKYIGYKVIPSMGNKQFKRKPYIEICKGYLFKLPEEDKDKFIMLRTKKITKEEFKDNKTAGEAAHKLLTAKVLEEWNVIVPVYPQSLLRTPWKMITKVRI